MSFAKFLLGAVKAAGGVPSLLNVNVFYAPTNTYSPVRTNIINYADPLSAYGKKSAVVSGNSQVRPFSAQKSNTRSAEGFETKQQKLEKGAVLHRKEKRSPSSPLEKKLRTDVVSFLEKETMGIEKKIVELKKEMSQLQKKISSHPDDLKSRNRLEVLTRRLNIYKQFERYHMMTLLPYLKPEVWGGYVVKRGLKIEDVNTQEKRDLIRTEAQREIEKLIPSGPRKSQNIKRIRAYLQSMEIRAKEIEKTTGQLLQSKMPDLEN